MRATLVSAKPHPNHTRVRSGTVSFSIPKIESVNELAEKLHDANTPYHGQAWGWETTYEPEINEPEAVVDVPDGRSGFTTQSMPLWTPASFTIGESGIWFYSLMWENGADQPPTSFLDDRGVAIGDVTA
jgi:hypothetical protein